MSTPEPAYPYVGPDHVKSALREGAGGGTAIRTAADFARWATARTPDELAEPFTCVIGTDGVLWLAPRRSEHVACAGGSAVLSAGEMGFGAGTAGWQVTEVSNLSTGYCPDAASWPAVARAVDRAGLGRPDGFTREVVFRRCPACREHNIVREGHFYCVFCDAALPHR
ncbi:hypothetical protein AB0F11_37800 [Streptomyces sp. NPDC032472]|uniref:hypothetical protein n=1 Tax=Streptomyces sp. NPDC032472 TaxID=3155018 RepID=UPI0033C772C4